MLVAFRADLKNTWMIVVLPNEWRNLGAVFPVHFLTNFARPWIIKPTILPAVVLLGGGIAADLPSARDIRGTILLQAREPFHHDRTTFN